MTGIPSVHPYIFSQSKPTHRIIFLCIELLHLHAWLKKPEPKHLHLTYTLPIFIVMLLHGPCKPLLTLNRTLFIFANVRKRFCTEVPAALGTCLQNNDKTYHRINETFSLAYIYNIQVYIGQGLISPCIGVGKQTKK